MADAPIFIDPEKCKGCTKCVNNCPFGALSMETRPERKQKLAVVDGGACRACNKCVTSCPFKAITMVETEKSP